MAVQYADILKMWQNLHSLDLFFSQIDMPAYQHHADKIQQCKDLIEKIADDSGAIDARVKWLKDNNEY